MQVKIGEKYYINCDQFCYWISRKHEVKSGKGACELIQVANVAQKAIKSIKERGDVV